MTLLVAKRGSYGAGLVGPAQEISQDTGDFPGKTVIVVNSGNYPSAIDNGNADEVFLIEAGTYTSRFNPPTGSLVKPRAGAVVQIDADFNNTITNDGWTIAGLSIDGQGARALALNITGATPFDGITVRNCKLRTQPAGTDLFRMQGNLTNLTIIGNDLDIQDGTRHALKVIASTGTPKRVPTGIYIAGNRLQHSLVSAGGSGDALQLEDIGVCIVEYNTFDNSVNENGLDVKLHDSMDLIIRRNLFDATNIAAATCLIQFGGANNTVPCLLDHNLFEGGDSLLNIGATFVEGEHIIVHVRGNVFLGDGLGSFSVRNQHSQDNLFEWNYMENGDLQLGTGLAGNQPHNLTVKHNRFKNVNLDKRTGTTWTCADNRRTGGTGWPDDCTGEQ